MLKQIVAWWFCLAVIVMLVACEASPGIVKHGTGEKLHGWPLIGIAYEGCEYLYVDAGYGYGPAMTHKGNCKNPIHTRCVVQPLEQPPGR